MSEITVPLKFWFNTSTEMAIPWFGIRAKDGYVDQYRKITHPNGQEELRHFNPRPNLVLRDWDALLGEKPLNKTSKDMKDNTK